MTFMLILQRQFEIKFESDIRGLRIALGWIAFVCCAVNLEDLIKRQASQEFAACEFLCHVLGHPSLAEVLDNDPRIKFSPEHIFFSGSQSSIGIRHENIERWNVDKAA